MSPAALRGGRRALSVGEGEGTPAHARRRCGVATLLTGSLPRSFEEARRQMLAMGASEGAP